MSYPFPADLQQLVDQQMATGRYRSEDQLLVQALQMLDDYDQAVADIQEGMANEAAGRTRSLAEVDADIRQRFGFAS